MVKVIGGGVKEHVQAFADALPSDWYAHISTYPSHQPRIDLALDIFPKNSYKTDAGQAQIKLITDFAVKNLEKFSGHYVISGKKIWNNRIAKYWRILLDRGSDTKNHLDHIHVSFNTIGKDIVRGFLLALSDSEQRGMMERLNQVWEAMGGLQDAQGEITGTSDKVPYSRIDQLHDKLDALIVVTKTLADRIEVVEGVLPKTIKVSGELKVN